VALTNPFRVWIPTATYDHPLVQQSECHQARQKPNSTSNYTCTLLESSFMIDLLKCSFSLHKDQIADIFIKSLAEAKFSKLQSMLGVQEVIIKGG
jgi:hypothetical protein